MSILLSNVGHACVGIDLKKSEISAMFITPEVNLTGRLMRMYLIRTRCWKIKFLLTL